MSSVTLPPTIHPNLSQEGDSNLYSPEDVMSKNKIKLFHTLYIQLHEDIWVSA
jgi:hypothetical protein